MEKKGCMSDVTRNLGKTLGIRERTSQMGLFTPKWMSNDLAKALHAVEKITDSQKLAEVAVNAKLQQVAGKAIERIQDESVLAGIALGDAGFFAVEKSLERVFHPDLLKQIADEAEMNWVRVAALSRLTKQNRNFDLLPYRDLIQVCVKAGNIDAVSLCTDRIILEDVYHLNRQQWLKDKKQWNVMRSFEERINQLASECIRDTQLPSGLKRFIAPGNLYSDEVRNAARAKLNAMILPENSSQEELYKAAAMLSFLRKPEFRWQRKPASAIHLAAGRLFALIVEIRLSTEKCMNPLIHGKSKLISDAGNTNRAVHGVRQTIPWAVFRSVTRISTGKVN